MTEYLPPRAEPAQARTSFFEPGAHVFDVEAPSIGMSCELDPDTVEFPHPGVASFVPDLSRPPRGRWSESSFRSPPVLEPEPVLPAAPVPPVESPVIEVPRETAPPTSGAGPVVEAPRDVVPPSVLLDPAWPPTPLAAEIDGIASAPPVSGTLAPVIGEACELDPDLIEFPHPNVASFVPTPGRPRGAFGLLPVTEPVHRSAPTVLPPDEDDVRPETQVVPAFEPVPEYEPVPVDEPGHEPASAHGVDPFDDLLSRPERYPDEDDDRDSFVPPAPVAASAHQWHATPDDVVPAVGRRRRGLVIGAGVGAAVLLIAGAVVVVPLLSQGDGGGQAGPVAAPGTTAAAVAWIADSIDPTSVLLVEDDLVDDVTSAGYPSDTVVSETTLSAAEPDSAWRAADYLLATPTLRETATGETSTALENSEAVARFGSGDTAVEVRRVLDEGSAQAAASAAVLTAARASAGGQLAANPALTTTPAARALLEEGRVDSRLVLLLAQHLAVSPLSVADFPVGTNEIDGVRHQMILSGYNGAGIPADTAATQSATTWLGSQSGDFVPTSVESTPEGLLVTLDLDEPSGLLPGAP